LGPQSLALVWLSILIAKTDSLESAFAGLAPSTRQLRDRMDASTHFRPINRLDCRATLRLSDDKPVGLFVGSLQPLKNFSLMRQLIEQLPQIRWLVALRGEVPRDLAGNANVCVFQDASYEQLPTLYGAADFSV
jgi:hypothetical protein